MEQPNPLNPRGLYSGVAGSLFGQVPYGGESNVLAAFLNVLYYVCLLLSLQ